MEKKISLEGICVKPKVNTYESNNACWAVAFKRSYNDTYLIAAESICDTEGEAKERFMKYNYDYDDLWSSAESDGAFCIEGEFLPTMESEKWNDRT